MITTIADLDRVRDECRRMVTQRSLLAAGAAVVPIPGVDLATDIGVLTTLLPRISERFGLSHEQVQTMEPHLARQVLVMAASLENTVIGRAVTKRIVMALLRRLGTRIVAGSVTRYVPVIGSAMAATIGFGAMKMIGNAHIEDCYRTARAALLTPAEG
jgi:uncharacterized protein (DUF697 family)